MNGSASPPRPRSWLSVRWRQLRNPPQPVLTAVAVDLAIATAGAAALLAYDVALSRGAALPGGDLRTAVFVAYVLLVALAGAWLTYASVLLPAGSTGVRRRSVWSAMLGFLAALPAAYLALVVCFQIVRPLLG